jgi:hypothetical protein
LIINTLFTNRDGCPDHYEENTKILLACDKQSNRATKRSAGSAEFRAVAHAFHGMSQIFYFLLEA